MRGVIRSMKTHEQVKRRGRAGATPYRKIREGLSEKLTLELRPG